MVKRPKSPVVEEDTRYFTVYQPYPLNANWLVDEDQKQCAKWIAECVGPDHLISIYHKPKARGMILVELSRLFTEHGAFLGEHRWKEILKDPDSLEENSVTKVFHSFYAKGRDAQKDGWKEIPVTRRWFIGWVPGKDSIVQPYPETHWCEVPPEDHTNKKLCRPLPAERKAPPPKVEIRPVVGSSQWVGATASDPHPADSAKAGWKKLDPPKLPDSLPKRPSSPAADRKNSDSLPKGPSSPIDVTKPIQSMASTSTGKWGKPIPLKHFTTTEKKSGSSGWATIKSPSVVPGKSPLAEAPPSGPVNAWAKPLKLPHAERQSSKRDTNTPPSSNLNSPWGIDTSPPSPSPAVQSWAEPHSPKKDKKQGWALEKERHSSKHSNDKNKEVDRAPPGLERLSAAKREERSRRKEPTPDWSGHVRNDDIWAAPIQKEEREPTEDYVTRWLNENIKGSQSQSETADKDKSSDLVRSSQKERDTSSRGGRDRDNGHGRNRDESRGGQDRDNSRDRNRGEGRKERDKDGSRDRHRGEGRKERDRNDSRDRHRGEGRKERDRNDSHDRQRDDGRKGRDRDHSRDRNRGEARKGRDKDDGRSRDRGEGRNEGRSRGEGRGPSESRDRADRGSREGGGKSESHSHQRFSSSHKFVWADEPFDLPKKPEEKENEHTRNTEWTRDAYDTDWKKTTTEQSSSNKRKTETQFDKYGKLTYQNDSRKRANLSIGGSVNPRGGRGGSRGRGEGRGRGRGDDRGRGHGKGKDRGTGRGGDTGWRDYTKSETTRNKDNGMEFGWPDEPVNNWMSIPFQLPPTPPGHKDIEMTDVKDDMIATDDKGKGKQKEEPPTEAMEDLQMGGPVDDGSWVPSALSAAQIEAEWGGADSETEWVGAGPSTDQAAVEWGGGGPSAAQAAAEWGGPVKSMDELAAEWGVSVDDVKQADTGTTSWEFPTEWTDIWNRDKKKEPVLICPTHGTTCKKGICRDMDRLVRAQREKGRENKPKKKFGGGLQSPKKKKDDALSGNLWNPNFSEENAQESSEVAPKKKKKTRRGGKSRNKDPMVLGKMRGFGGDIEDDSDEEGEEEGEGEGNGTEKVGHEGDKVNKSGEEGEESDGDNHGDDGKYEEIKNDWTADNDWD